MQQFNEKRDSRRLDVDCEVHCRSMDSNELHQAVCVNLSGSGVSLITEHDFRENEEVEVNIFPESKAKKTKKFYIEIVRKHLQEDGLTQYGARILFEKSAGISA